jgi:hypothetical protein
MEQMRYAVDIFKYLHPDKVGIWLFDCSSAHEGLMDDALNVNNMNVNLGTSNDTYMTQSFPLIIHHLNLVTLTLKANHRR